MTSAWEVIRRHGRRSPRYQLRLTASVLIYEGIEEGHLPAALAYTRDVSKNGLCLIMPDSGSRFFGLEEGPRPVRITLALLAGSIVELVGETVHILPYRAGDHGREYLVGVHLGESEGLATYREFIDIL